MNPFDAIIIVILGFCLVRGLFRGLVKEVFSMAGVLGGFYASYSFYTLVAKRLSVLISNHSYLNILSFLIIFCTVLIAFNILGIIIKYLLNIAFLGWVDRMFGVAFGFTKGILVVSVLFLVLTAFLPRGAPVIKDSVLAPHVAWVSENMARVVSRKMKQDFANKLGALKKTWQQTPKSKKKRPR
jgi:membrane protein required for colicin V production